MHRANVHWELTNIAKQPATALVYCTIMCASTHVGITHSINEITRPRKRETHILTQILSNTKLRRERDY